MPINPLNEVKKAASDPVGYVKEKTEQVKEAVKNSTKPSSKGVFTEDGPIDVALVPGPFGTKIPVPFPNLQKGTELAADLIGKLPFFPFNPIDIIDIITKPPGTKPTQPTQPTTGNAKFDDLAGQVEDVNKTIDELLADYQKALDAGEDTFVIQTKIQQAMQRRLELITLLSNLQKMEHDANMAVINNIR